MISVDYLKENFSYNPESGLIFPLNGGSRFRTVHSAGYYTGCVKYKVYKAHRVAWALYYGEWPDKFVDHKNGDGFDNSISNLMLATRSQNQHNRKTNANNTSGYKGVYWKKHRNGRTGAWVAEIVYNGKRYPLGRFTCPKDAYGAYCKAAVELHGEFARLS